MSGAMAVVAIVGLLAQLASIGSAFWLGGRLLHLSRRAGARACAERELPALGEPPLRERARLAIGPFN